MAPVTRPLVARPAPRSPRAPTALDGGLVGVLSLLGGVGGLLASSPLGAALCALSPAPLLWRRDRPGFALASLVAVLVLARVGALGDVHPVSASALDLAAVVAGYAAVRWGSPRDVAVGAALATLAVASAVWSAPEAGAARFTALDGLLRWGLPGVTGYVVRLRAAAARHRLRDARRDERLAIARDLHDALGHHLTAIAVQAQLAQAAYGARPDLARSAVAAVEEAASRALAEMRRAVGSLREADGPSRSPQRGVADLVRLADPTLPGPATDLDLDADLPDLGPALDAAVYRVAQEAVTNARRHATDARRIEVALRRTDDALRLSVTDDGARARPGPAGFGIVGMRERTERLGGRFEAGPAPGGGWRVQASFPLP